MASFGIIFRSLRSTWRPRTGWRGFRRSRRTSRSEILTWGVTQLLSMLETWFWCQKQCPPWPPTAPPLSSEASENCPKWLPIPQNIGFATRTMSLACTEAELLPKLEFYFLKSFLTSYSPSTLFLTCRSIWGFSKRSQMIPHTPKHCFCYKNHVSNMLRSSVTP